eukprot:6203548-Pleurochrysis_carterae.AAC.2
MESEIEACERTKSSQCKYRFKICRRHAAGCGLREGNLNPKELEMTEIPKFRMRRDSASGSTRCFTDAYLWAWLIWLGHEARGERGDVARVVDVAHAHWRGARKPSGIKVGGELLRWDQRVRGCGEHQDREGRHAAMPRDDTASGSMQRRWNLPGARHVDFDLCQTTR